MKKIRYFFVKKEIRSCMKATIVIILRRVKFFISSSEQNGSRVQRLSKNIILNNISYFGELE